MELVLRVFQHNRAQRSGDSEVPDLIQQLSKLIGDLKSASKAGAIHMRLFPVKFVMLVFVAGAVANAQAPPPAIDMASLRAGASGVNLIFGSVHSTFVGATAFCVPDIPYVEWYFGSWGHPGSAPYYDSRLIAYTRRASIDEDGRFMLGGLAPGQYIVWISGDRFLDVLTYGPPVTGNPVDGQTADRAGKYVKRVAVENGSAIVTF